MAEAAALDPFVLPPRYLEYRRLVREYVEEHVAPVAASLDANAEFPEALVKEAARRGFAGTLVPERYGGCEWGTFGGSIVVDEISRVCPSTAVTLSIHNSLVCGPLAKFGSDELKQRYLPKLAGGEMLGAYALSEAGSGSDAAALATRAHKKGDRWVLEGSKLWISSGTHAGLFLIFARTSDHEKKSRGITAFLVEGGAAGLKVGKKEDKLGLRASTTVEILLDQCEVPEDAVVGEVDRGFPIAMDTLDGGRIGIASQASGITRGCLDAAIAHAKQREQFGGPIARFQATRWKIADIATRLDAAKLLIRRAAERRDRGEKCAKEASMAKLFASTLANEAAEQAVQIHGAAGYERGSLVERLFRDARVTEIYEGTTEIQRLVIAREILDHGFEA